MISAEISSEEGKLKYIVSLLVVTSFMLMGCQSTGVIQMDQDSYYIGKKEGKPGLGVSLSNKAEVYDEATAYCNGKGLDFEVIRETVTPAVPGRLGSTELYFKCVSPEKPEDSSSKKAEEWIEQVEFYQNEASGLTSSDIYEEIMALRALQNDMFDEANTKGTGYLQELDARREANEPYAAFYYGIFKFRICKGMEDADDGQFADAANSCWEKSLESLTVASNAGIAEATYNIGLMHEKGWGDVPSKFVAADWYIKATQQAIKSKDREIALTSVERALEAVPDHPTALKLKDELFQ
jgi:hypothetical protein